MYPMSYDAEERLSRLVEREDTLNKAEKKELAQLLEAWNAYHDQPPASAGMLLWTPYPDE